jgi:hypothetical protein
MTVIYFGSTWDAPLFDDPTRVRVWPVPVGSSCLHCDEPIKGDDRGLIITYGTVENGKSVGKLVPVHMECNLRSVLGSVEHLEGRCFCTTRRVDAVPEGSFRDEARAVLGWFNVRRKREGRPPL